jgi:DNA ligase (NAD+)
MGSLNKTQTDEEFAKWYNKYIKPGEETFLTLKLDGLSISITYENGLLIRATTRGNGSAGEIITPNVARMIGVPLRLNQKINATVRGEILLSKENYDKYFKAEGYTNCRNSASGVSRGYDGKGCDKLTVLVYQLFSDDLLIKTQKDQFEKLKELGFITPTYYVFASMKEVIDMKNKYNNDLRNKYEFDLDGMVAHNNDLAKQKVFGDSHGRPYASVAIKFDHAVKITTLIDVIWQVGHSGRITPVAIFTPVIIDGAELEQASLHNVARVEELKLYKGCSILVSRRNGVIPFIEERL